ncbi:nuclear transport factor 2 family protein [Sphaerisporangium fuscum]|uniref:nuclear transport factor 2 family protein n=1 Tax=Sphaerisporangium fuscum TaxID=2835868 RepID=UPI001BDD2EDD|nr:nuclear transport factor 2 family protein [Sphaerisporangium fuscum]
MTPRELADAYLAALSKGDLDRILALFAPGAMVYSPMYGPNSAVDFFPKTLGDSSASYLTLRGVTTGETVTGTRLVNIWFHYDWRLPSGRPAPFDVVDVMELDAEGRIAAMHIVYDTIDVRPAYEEDTGHPSYRKPRD